MAEVVEQMPNGVDHIVVSVGSGGTLAGIVLGNLLSGLNATVWAVCACDDAAEFTAVLRNIAAEIDCPLPADLPLHFVESGVGEGYAVSTPAELEHITALAKATGVVLDPVYSGKALYAFMNFVDALPVAACPVRPGQSVLFVHTGGQMGGMAQDKLDLQEPLVEGAGVLDK